MPDQNQRTRQYIVSQDAVRRGFLLGGGGMVAVILALLILITSRPQGQLQVLDDGQHQALLAEADARLSGFEMLEDGAARIDIEHAMRLVVERGVDLAIAPPAEPAPDEPGVMVAEVDGAAVYTAQCAACHQANGAGIPSAFPPLAGHVGDLYAADTEYLVDVMLYGLQGQIMVAGVSYNGLMPAFGQLSDDEIAAVLNHVLSAWGDADELGDAFVPYVPEDVAEQRGLGLTASDVLQARNALDLE